MSPTRIRTSTYVDYIHLALVGFSAGLLWQGNRLSSSIHCGQFLDQHSDYQLPTNTGISSTIICSYFHSLSLLSSCETYKRMSPLSSKSPLLPCAWRIFLTENRLRSSANMGINWLLISVRNLNVSRPFNKQFYVTVQNFYVHIHNTGLSFHSATQAKCSTRAGIGAFRRHLYPLNWVHIHCIQQHKHTLFYLF